MWDYEGDGYVHRLIREKEGKVVELGVADRAAVRGEGESAVVGGSAEGKEVEWGMLLSAQLDTQREWYEERMAEVRDEAERARAELGALEARERERAALLEEERERERERERSAESMARTVGAVQTKLADATARIASLSSALAAECALSKGLLDNLERAKEREAKEREGREREEKERAEMRGRMQDLEEQVRDLMVFIEVGRRIEDAAEGEEAGSLGEARGGSVVVPAIPNTASTAEGRKKKGKKK